LPLIDRPVFACFLPPMLLLAHAAAMPPRYFADFCRFARFQLLSLACRFARFFISGHAGLELFFAGFAVTLSPMSRRFFASRRHDIFHYY
jgi:hypothetical protein